MNLYFKLIRESMRKIWLRFSDPWWKNVTSLGVFTWNVPNGNGRGAWQTEKQLLLKSCFAIKSTKTWKSAIIFFIFPVTKLLLLWYSSGNVASKNGLYCNRYVVHPSVRWFLAPRELKFWTKVRWCVHLNGMDLNQNPLSRKICFFEDNLSSFGQNWTYEGSFRRS
jgi:hypothetical protein